MTSATSQPGEPQRDSGGSPRILLVSNMWPGSHDPVFGVFVSRHVRALREAGASVRVVANTDARSSGPKNARKYVALMLRSLGAALRGDYDVVIGHYLYPTAAIAALAARLARAPLVLVAHGTDVRSIQRDGAIARACRGAISRAALVVTVSEALGASLREAAVPDSSARYVAINMGVDTSVFAPDAHARAELGIPAEERLLLFAGKLVPVKGLEVLLDAFAVLREQDAADRLVIVGDGPLAGALRDRARSLGIADRVRFEGQLAQRDVARWMSAADVFVLSSRDEGLGLVLLEAMACGTPCVGTAVGGIPEALAPGCGLIVEPGRADTLAAAVARVLETGKGNMTAECVRYASTQSVDTQARRLLAEIERSEA